MNVPESIELEHITLRWQICSDEKPFVRFMLDPECTKYLSFNEEQKTKQGAKELLTHTINSYRSEKPLFILSAEDKQGNYIGVCGLNPLEDLVEIEIFYTLDSAQTKKGFALEMVNGLIGYLRKEEQYQRVIAYIVPENTSAQNVACKAGFKNIGLVSNTEFGKVYNFVYELC